MESLLESAETTKIMRCYDVNEYWDHSFFKGEDKSQITRKRNKLRDALNFVSFIIKGDDCFKIQFQEAFD